MKAKVEKTKPNLNIIFIRHLKHGKCKFSTEEKKTWSGGDAQRVFLLSPEQTLQRLPEGSLCLLFEGRRKKRREKSERRKEQE